MSAGNPRVYVGNLPVSVRERDIEDRFTKYGRIKRIDMKMGFGFIEFEDARDAEDSIRALNGMTIDGVRIFVEPARGGRANTEGSGLCFNCRRPGHWAVNCPERQRSVGGMGGMGAPPSAYGGSGERGRDRESSYDRDHSSSHHHHHHHRRSSSSGRHHHHHHRSHHSRSRSGSRSRSHSRSPSPTR